MKELFVLEIRRCFRSKGFKTALVIGIGIAAAHAIQFFLYIYGLQKAGVDPSYLLLTESYLGEDYVLVWHAIYYWLLPVLAALPFSTSHFTDAHSGYLNQLAVRKKKGQIYAVRYLVTYLSGSVIVLLPLMINLFIMAAFFPVGTPQSFQLTSVISQTGIMGDLHYSSPLAYTFAFWLITVLFGGLFACTSLVLSLFIKNTFYITIIPAFILLFWDLLAQQIHCTKWSPLCMINEAQDYALAWKPIIITVSVGIIITYFIFVVCKSKKDILGE